MDQSNALSLRGGGLVGMGSWPQSSDWLIRDEFTDTVAAGSVNGTAATPGPGTRAVTDAGSTISIGSGVLSCSGAGSDVGTYARYAVTRSTGLAAIGRIATPNPNGGRHHFAFGPAGSFYGYQFASGGGLSIQINSTFADTTGPAIGTYDTSEEQIAIIARSTGYLFLRKISGNWQLDWVGITDNTSALYARVSGTKAFTADDVYAIQLPAPFDTDDGLATDTHSGSVAAGTTFTHEANCLIEFTVVSVGTSGTTYVDFRAQDTNNKWSIVLTDTGDLKLFEYVAGAPAQRSNATGVVSNGHRVVIVADGTTIKGYSNNTLRWTYSSATNFATATAGSVRLYASSGEASDLKTWPRTLSGTAASILNKVSA